MSRQYIKNFKELAITKEREDLLNIINSAYEAIDTTEIINHNISMNNHTLTISDKTFDTNNFKNIHVIGFGKASSVAVMAIENILKNKVAGGIVMDKKIGECKIVKQYICTHPKPSTSNILPSEDLARLSKSLDEKDLAIVVVSGGGSSMLCWPESECEQGIILYNEFLKSGGNIKELNVLRKHISALKGGGLAKLLYPATVIALIFCDVPGNTFEDVASGPTYKDSSTIKDAKSILLKYNLPLNIIFNETPKEDMYFEKVYNIPLVDNTFAIQEMEKKAKDLGYKVINLGSNLYESVDSIIDKLLEKVERNTVVIGAGEPSVVVRGTRGINGRCEYLTIKSLQKISPDDCLSSFASDGIDNLSISAGAIADKITLEKARNLQLSINENIMNNTIDEFFTKTGDQIITGETGSNVSDLMILLRR